MESCWIQITAGQGPDECALAVKHVMHQLMEGGRKMGLEVELLEAIGGSKNGTYISVLIALKGIKLLDFTCLWQGTIKWVCQSPYRPTHKRKNWFVAVDVLMPTANDELLDKKQVQFQTMKASGPGGQHVNTTNSAVRITHIPTGITIKASEEKSQHMNKKLALSRLLLLLEEKNYFQKASKAKEKWKRHQSLKRGNPIRLFLGRKFKEKRIV